MSGEIDTLEQRHKVLRKHYFALADFIQHKLSGVGREAFKQMYPRTYNAIVTHEPYSFDLPQADE